MKLPTTLRESHQTQPPVETGELVLKITAARGTAESFGSKLCVAPSARARNVRCGCVLPGLAPLACEIDRTAEPP